MAHLSPAARVPAAVVAAGLLLPGASPAQEGESRPTGWFFTGEVSAVWTGGNAESNTAGVTTTLRRVWRKTEARLDAGAVRTRSTITSRTAVGTSPDNFEIVEESETETTAESYFARSRVDYTVTAGVFLFGGADWLRNTFAGIDSRFLLAAGAGNAWIEKERVRLKSDYGFTWTFQEDVVENPFLKTSFPGVRLSYDVWTQLTSTAEFTSVMVVDWNLDNTDDVRFELTNALPVTISSHLALRPSLQLVWRRDPSVTAVDLIAPDGTPTGTRVLVPLEKLDSLLRVALVVRI